MSSYSTQHELERTTWPNKLEYHLSLFCFILGLASFWRFPYLAYENGGAPFLYVFLFLYILMGIPLVFLEMAWGQYGNLAPLQAFKIVPAMQGVGVCMLFLSSILTVYYGVASYYILVYLASSFATSLPWSSCDHEWNTEKCQTQLDPSCVMAGFPGLQVDPKMGYGMDVDGKFVKKTPCNYTSDGTYTSPTVEYWANNLIYNDSLCTQYSRISDILFGSSSSTALIAPIIILACFVGARFLIALVAMANHVRLTGKVAYLLSTFPFAVIVMLLVRCVTLTGSTNGLSYLFIPSNAESFFTPKLWKDACSQVFISLMLSWGGLISWSSYNRFYNKYHIDASMLLPVVPVLSIISCVSVFGVVGYLATVSDVGFEEALREAKGPFAPLVAYSEGLSQMWGNTLPWSIVVFVTMFLSSTSAILPCLECILSCISDGIPAFRSLLLRNVTVVFLLLTSFAAYYGIPCVLQGSGLQIIEFFDTFCLPLCCMIVALAEILMLSYSFGFKLLYTNTKAMTGNSCLKSHFWTVMWGGVCPLVILGCLVYTIVGIVRDGVDAMAPYLPQSMRGTWTTIAGAVVVAFVFLVLILVAVIKVLQSPGPLKEKLHNAFTPHLSRLSGNGGGNLSHTNGDLFMSDYTSHRERGIEILIDEDIVTSV
ncbi:sodium- and chloride-dependent glycine transporter 2-like [Clavelina lepadiformis]|uniref:sodium- and chloride-dependent glycine transporter 2-like n=1 Tax=Clavelina lepadiformis TaxID=159417 RepID=UPI004041437C